MGNKTESLFRLLAVMAFASATVTASTSRGVAQSKVATYGKTQPLVIKNDRGGLVRTRLRQLKELRKSGKPVRITGRICYSTCTMFLGLPQTCVSAKTTFGFHGPSSYGRSLDPGTFDQASRVISAHYPPAIRAWYMERGRYKIRSVYKIKGQQLIDLGVRSC